MIDWKTYLYGFYSIGAGRKKGASKHCNAPLRTPCSHLFKFGSDRKPRILIHIIDEDKRNSELVTIFSPIRSGTERRG